jgi:hypothetical protein
MGDKVYITGIRFRKHGAKDVQGWKLSAGIGKMRPVVTISGTDNQLETLAIALKFALSGKRSENLEEVWLDAVDDAGDVWTIERGIKGSVFRQNNRLLSLEDAQRSLLASLLDLDASLSQSEGLVAPLELRQIISRESEVAAIVWDLGVRASHSDVAGLIAAKEVAKKCALKANVSGLSDPIKLAQIADPCSGLLGAFRELKRQEEKLGCTSKSPGPADDSLESMQAEVEILNQIDQLVRRINGGGESFTRLSALHESTCVRVLAIEEKWTKETLAAVNQLSDSCQILDQLVALRAWSRFIENLTRVAAIMDTKVRPTNVEGVKVWTNFLAGSRTSGQDIESCLASMLLGVKQMGQEMDRYSSQSFRQVPNSILRQVVTTKHLNWFDRFKFGTSKVVDEQIKDVEPALKHQREWISRLAREIESVKVATEYALQTSQALTDVVTDAQVLLDKDSSALNALVQKAVTEHERLKADWSIKACELGISESIGMKQFSDLLRDATEYLIIMHSREDLALRVADRVAVQAELETHVRRWWKIIGSQKEMDLSNVSFLIVEARATLRYREGRQNRIQKGLNESSRALGAKSTATWISSRLQELSKDWSTVFLQAGLPPIDISSDLVAGVVSAAQRCAALLEIVRVEERDRFAAASLWPSRLDSVVVVYRWADINLAAEQRAGFLKALPSFIGDSGIPVLLLVSDSELAGVLQRSGTGGATTIELGGVNLVDGPRRVGAVVRAELKGKRVVDPAPKAPTIIKGSEPPQRKALLNPRAEAALRVLNPRPTK